VLIERTFRRVVGTPPNETQTLRELVRGICAALPETMPTDAREDAHTALQAVVGRSEARRFGRDTRPWPGLVNHRRTLLRLPRARKAVSAQKLG